MQRLPQVMAGGGEELGLGAVGDLGLLARGICGAFLDAQLRQQVVGLQFQFERALQCLAVVAGEQREKISNRMPVS